jgi:hypothetical protein
LPTNQLVIDASIQKHAALHKTSARIGRIYFATGHKGGALTISIANSCLVEGVSAVDVNEPDIFEVV